MHNEISDYLRMIDDADNAHSPTSRAVYADALILVIRDYFTDDELIELVQAKAEGRLVVLPCKVGDTVYRKARFCDTVIDATVSQLTINKFGLQGAASKGESTRFHFDSEDIGERVFFTREAAEKALGGAEDGK